MVFRGGLCDVDGIKWVPEVISGDHVGGCLISVISINLELIIIRAGMC